MAWWTMRERVTWWTMREEGDMVDYEGEGDTDVFSLLSLKRGIFFVHQVIKFIMCGQL